MSGSTAGSRWSPGPGVDSAASSRSNWPGGAPRVVVNDIGSSADEARYGDGGSTAARPRSNVAGEITAARRYRGRQPGRRQRSRQRALDRQRREYSTFHRIDIIVNNAGVVITNDFADLTLADLDTCLGVARAWRLPGLPGRLAIPGQGRLRRILNVCSVDGVLFGNQRHTAYDAAKGLGWPA